MFFQRCWTCSKAFPLFSHALNGSKKWAFGWQVEVPPKAVGAKGRGAAEGGGEAPAAAHEGRVQGGLDGHGAQGARGAGGHVQGEGHGEGAAIGIDL